MLCVGWCAALSCHYLPLSPVKCKCMQNDEHSPLWPCKGKSKNNTVQNLCSSLLLPLPLVLPEIQPTPFTHLCTALQERMMTQQNWLSPRAASMLMQPEFGTQPHQQWQQPNPFTNWRRHHWSMWGLSLFRSQISYLLTWRWHPRSLVSEPTDRWP